MNRRNLLKLFPAAATLPFVGSLLSQVEAAPTTTETEFFELTHEEILERVHLANPYSKIVVATAFIREAKKAGKPIRLLLPTSMAIKNYTTNSFYWTAVPTLLMYNAAEILIYESGKPVYVYKSRYRKHGYVTAV